MADNRPAAARGSDRRDIEVHTWGAHAIASVDAGPGKIDGLVWAAVQSGDWGRLDHFGWAYALEAGYQLPDLPAAPWLRAGYDRSSGDDNPNDAAHGTFFQIPPTARIYAQLPFYNMMNTEDLFAQLIARPHPRLEVRTDYHWLRLSEPADLWYAGGGATNDTFFGYAAFAGWTPWRSLSASDSQVLSSRLISRWEIPLLDVASAPRGAGYLARGCCSRLG